MRSPPRRYFGISCVFAVCLLSLLFVSAWAWEKYVDGTLYYCTDDLGAGFILPGTWVHHPESVARVVPWSMSEPDEIKAGWSVPGLWCLWWGFIVGSLFVSASIAGGIWRATAHCWQPLPCPEPE